MKPFIVVSDGMDEAFFNELLSVEEFDVHPERVLSQEGLAKLLPRVAGLVVRSRTKVLPGLLDRASRLKYVIRAGEGTDNIDKSACAGRGIKVSNTPGANNLAAAEHTVALMLSVLRHTARAHLSMKGGKWEKGLFTGLELTGKTVGIVGLGKIGTLVAEKLMGFEPDVLYFDPSVETSDLPYVKAVSSLEEIFRRSDIVTVHVPLMESTRGLIDGGLIGLMRPHGVLINAARGGIVDEGALCRALSEGKIRGAGVDVFASGTLEQDSGLRRLDNVVLTPHLGASTEEAQARVGGMVVHLLKEFFLNGNHLHGVGG